MIKNSSIIEWHVRTILMQGWPEAGLERLSDTAKLFPSKQRGDCSCVLPGQTESDVRVGRTRVMMIDGESDIMSHLGSK